MSDARLTDEQRDALRWRTFCRLLRERKWRVVASMESGGTLRLHDRDDALGQVMDNHAFNFAAMDDAARTLAQSPETSAPALDSEPHGRN